LLRVCVILFKNRVGPRQQARLIGDGLQIELCSAAIRDCVAGQPQRKISDRCGTDITRVGVYRCVRDSIQNEDSPRIVSLGSHGRIRAYEWLCRRIYHQHRQICQLGGRVCAVRPDPRSIEILSIRRSEHILHRHVDTLIVKCSDTSGITIVFVVHGHGRSGVTEGFDCQIEIERRFEGDGVPVGSYVF
jgi:hypothetical protein